ncbi:MAG: DNA/RNA helicase domain-containing protein [Vicinamibacteria bacterium]
MLLEVQEFSRRVAQDLDGLIADLERQTGRANESERWAWRIALDRAAHVLNHPDLANFHLHVGQRGGVSIEYRLPASGSWCDLVLLGQGVSAPAAVIVEFKDWNTYGDRSGPTEGLIWHNNQLELHPADQVRGYAEYCRYFHSAVLERQAEVNGCVYFTQPLNRLPYTQAPHERLVAAYPLFSDTPLDADPRFVQHLAGRLIVPNARFAQEFEKGTYLQDRAFCTQVAAQIADPAASPFVLLDHQRRGLELCKAKIEEALASSQDPEARKVILIEGPPGSGKSAIAAQLWAWLARDGRFNGQSFVVTTTSSSQRRNWESLFRQAAGGRPGARGFVRPANAYAPADPKQVNQFLEGTGGQMPAELWPENVRLWDAKHGGPPDPGATLVSIVDEAHALINPKLKKARTPAGYFVGFGPQAYHIIRSSRVSVFLMDEDQGFRDRECTTRDVIVELARGLEAEFAPAVSLAGAQFRLAGSVEYMSWLDELLGLGEGRHVRAAWRRSPANPRAPLVFDIVPDPLALEEALRSHVAVGESARLLAAYGVPWVTQKKASGGKAKAQAKKGASGYDFDIAYRRDGRAQRWRKVWNMVPRGDDYTLFVQAPKGSAMAEDPLSEVGCPYVVRGFDYDWVGVVWLGDLIWRDGAWTVDLDHIHETGVKGSLQAARKERKAGRVGPAHAELVRRVAQAYRVLLSRAMKGLYVWIADDETRARVLDALTAGEGAANA